MLKKGIRAIALDDAAFKRKGGKALVVGVVGRSDAIDGVISFHVDVDGADATGKLMEALRGTRFGDQIKIIAMNGITFGGLNVVDLGEVHSLFNVPVVAITRKKPHAKLLEEAVREVDKGAAAARKIEAIKRIEESAKQVRAAGFYLQCIGIDAKEAKAFAGMLTKLLRLSHIIASGIARGQSSGRV